MISTAHEQELDDILQTVADAILIVDREGAVKYANAASERIFARPVSEILGNSFGLPIVADATTELDIVQGGAKAVVGELRAVDIVWRNHPAHVISIRDITERKEAAAQAEQLVLEQMARAQAEVNERRARFLIDATNALAASPDYAICLNDLACKCTGYFADWCVIDLVETDGQLKRLAVAHSTPERAEIARGLAQLAPETHPLPGEPDVLRRGEPYVVNKVEVVESDDRYRELLHAINPQSIMMIPLQSRQKTMGAIALISSRPGSEYSDHDLTTAIELGRFTATAIDNAKLMQEARIANETKANFVAVMSHELRTPLNAVIGYADLLTLGVPVAIPEPGLDHVQRIRTCAQRLLRLTEGILAFSRMNLGQEQVDHSATTIYERADNAARIMAPVAEEKGLKFVMHLPENDCPIVTDVTKFDQILLNLLDNAVKFSAREKIELDIKLMDDWTHFDVKDSGPGIASEHHERIFEPFWQAEQTHTRRGEGIGMGLTIARRFAQLLGGNVILQSSAPEGSMFTLMLPNRPL